MKTIPKNWRWTTIGEVVEPVIEQSGPSGKGSFTYIDISSIDNKRKAITEPKTLHVKEAPSRARQKLLPNDVLVSMTRPNLNAVAIVPSELRNAIGSTGFCVLRAKEVIPKLLFYLTQTSSFINAMCEVVQGALYPAVRPKDIKNHQIPVAPIDEQEKIVEEIETQFTRLDAGVTALKRAQANLKRYRAAVLKAACEGKLVPTEAELAKAEGRSYETGEQLLQRILAERRAKWEEENKKGGKKKDVEPKGPEVSKLPKLPEGWAWATVGQVSNTVQYGYTASANKNTSGVRFLRITDIQNGNVNWDVVPTCKIPGRIIKDYKLQTDDIVFARTGATVGKSFRLRGQFPESVFASYLIRVKPTSQLLSDWLDVCFQSPDYWSQIKVSSVGIGQPNVNGTKLCALRVPIPPAKEQQRIVNEVERMSSVMDELDNVLTASNKRSDNLRNAVLQHMLILNTK